MRPWECSSLISRSSSGFRPSWAQKPVVGAVRGAEEFPAAGRMSSKSAVCKLLSSDAETQLKLLLSFTSTVSIFWCVEGFKQHIVDDADVIAGEWALSWHAVADFDPQSLAKSPLLPYQTLCKWTHVWRRHNQLGNFLEVSGKKAKISSTWFFSWGLDCYRTSIASCFEFWRQVQSTISYVCLLCFSLEGRETASWLCSEMGGRMDCLQFKPEKCILWIIKEKLLS